MPTASKRPASRDNAEKTERQGPPPDPSMALSEAIKMFDEEFDKLKLEGKIATISGYIGRIPKNGYNKFNSYPYVLESDLVEHIRYWLAAARILIYPTVKEWVVVPGIVTERRSGDARTDILFTFRVVDGRTGETFEFDTLGQGSDPRDKGSNKASTSAMKFAYMRLFNIASGEEAEADEKGDADAALRGEGGGTAPTITPSAVPNVERGGRQANASETQIKTISNLSNQLDLGAVGLVGVIKKVLDEVVELPEDEKQQGRTLSAYLKGKNGEDVGKLIFALQELVKAVPGKEPEEPGGGYPG